jgi:hypothetical protein
MTRQRARTLNVLTPLAAGLAIFVASGPVQPAEAWRFSDWSEPQNVGAEVNSAFEDIAPHLSSDGLALYFASTRTGSAGGEDLWVSRRASRHDPWGVATNLGAAINTAANERSPALSRNRRLLFFATDRPGGAGGFDIWLSWRANPDDDAGWQPPVNLGTGVNTAATDAGPSFLDDDLRPSFWTWWRPEIPQLFMASTRPGGPGGLDIYLASVPGGWAGPAALVAELSTPQNDLTPTVRRDGLEIIIASNRPGTFGGFDLYQSFRRSVNEPWSAPTNLGPLVNSTSIDLFPSLSFDARTLVFQSARPGGFGGIDIYVSTR